MPKSALSFTLAMFLSLHAVLAGEPPESPPQKETSGNAATIFAEKQANAAESAPASVKAVGPEVEAGVLTDDEDSSDPGRRSADELDEKARDQERANYWAAKGFRFDPSRMTAAMMDERAAAIDRAEYWRQYGHWFDPTEITAAEMDAQADERGRAAIRENGEALPSSLYWQSVGGPRPAGTPWPAAPSWPVNPQIQGLSVGPVTGYQIRDAAGWPYGSGTSIPAGPVLLHTLRGAGGEEIRGTSMSSGAILFHNLNSSDGHTVQGTSIRAGQLVIHQMEASDGSTINGTSLRAGNVWVHDFNVLTGNQDSWTPYGGR